MQKLIAIVGPTAAGKTDISLTLAKEFGGFVICADSRTIYQEMDIGTAKPYCGQEYKTVGACCCTPRAQNTAPLRARNTAPLRCIEINGIPHFGLNLIKPNERFSVAEFQKYANQIIREHATIECAHDCATTGCNHIPLLVGGSGLYISAVVDNLAFPDAPPSEKFRAKKELLSREELWRELITLNPTADQIVDQWNKRRIIRALEIIEQTNKPVLQQRLRGKPQYNILMLGITRKREELYQQINQRVEKMMQMGFEDEVKKLRNTYGCDCAGMSGIGYNSFCKYLNGDITRDQAIEKFKQGDRNLAKRQMTWFKRDLRIRWIHNIEEARELVEQFLNGV